MGARVPLEYLLSASDSALLNFEQSRLNRWKNLLKEIEAMTSEAQTERANADVARWLLDHRKELLRSVGGHLERVRSSESDAA